MTIFLSCAMSHSGLGAGDLAFPIRPPLPTGLLERATAADSFCPALARLVILTLLAPFSIRLCAPTQTPSIFGQRPGGPPGRSPNGACLLRTGSPSWVNGRSRVCRRFWERQFLVRRPTGGRDNS